MTISVVGNGSAVADYSRGGFGIMTTPDIGYYASSVLELVGGVVVANLWTYYQLYGWKVCAEYLVYDPSMSATSDYIVSFAPLPGPFAIVASAMNSGGSISPSGASYVARGGSKTYTITCNPGYGVDVVIERGTRFGSTGVFDPQYFSAISIGSVASFTFTNVIENCAIKATFYAVSLSITASAGTNGSISPNGTSPITVGQSRTFTFSPNPGYQVDTVLVDGVSVGSPSSYTFSNVTASHTISVTFKVLDGYLITASAGSNGTITPSGSVVAVKGTNKSFVIAPDQYYSIVDVLVDGVSAGAVSSYVFSNVQEAHTISATFAKIPYTMISIAGAHGSIIPSGELIRYQGDTQSYIIVPDEGYVIQDVMIDGVYVDIPASGVLFID